MSVGPLVAPPGAAAPAGVTVPRPAPLRPLWRAPLSPLSLEVPKPR
jgi:hypothetical protein